MPMLKWIGHPNHTIVTNVSYSLHPSKLEQTYHLLKELSG
jgi:hypothetical protein